MSSNPKYQALQPTGGKVNAQLAEVKSIVQDNIGKLAARGERLDEIAEKAEALEANANMFKTTAVKVKRKMWWQDMKMKAILGIVITVIVLLVILIVLGQLGLLRGGGTTTTTTVVAQPAATGAARLMQRADAW